MLLAATLGAAMAACGGETAGNPLAPTVTVTTSAPAGTLPSWYGLFGNGTQVSVEGSMVVLRTTDVPDHPSPYFGPGHPLYEPPHEGMQMNPHRIAAQNITLRVPASPAVSSPSDTPLGPIGLAVNGVVFFNQYAAMRQPLTFEILSFDRYRGHPAPSDTYHYHVEPVWLTQVAASRLIGVLLDGFPVYGPVDAGGTAPSDLDSCHGHTGATPEFPGGVYHYHTTDQAPYISGCFRGSPGSVGM
jgi:hypothetical protein